MELPGDELATQQALHQDALKQAPKAPRQNGEYWAAVLPPDNDPHSSDPKSFHWFKVKSKHTVSKIQGAYFKKTGVSPVLRQGNRPISLTEKMCDINYFGDDIVVFWSTSNVVKPESKPSREPLQPLKTQPRAPPSARDTPSGLKPGVGLDHDHAKAKPEPIEPPFSPHTPDPLLRQKISSPSVQQVTQPLSTGLPPLDPIAGYELFAARNRDSYTPLRISPAQGGISLVPCWNGLSQSARDRFGDLAAQISGSGNPSLMPPNSRSNPIPGVERQTPVDQSSNYGTPITSELEEVWIESKKEESPPSMGGGVPEIAPPVVELAKTRLQKVIEESTPEQLEKEVRKTNAFLDVLKDHFKVPEAAQHQDAKHWLKQIESLQAQSVDTPTIIGVVGNTGSGKSSAINAILDEERLVPTNCMRACTAVVTELSWNPSDDPDKKYRAEIEFIKASDWQKDLEVSLNELIDGSGNISRDCNNAESEAGVAYAKIKAVYPNKTKEMLAESTVEELMREQSVRSVLGTTKTFEKSRPEHFYKELQTYVDSKEKSTGDKDKSSKEKVKKTMEFWPLIKVVRIYTKADALSTGAVIVDLPGVHDSNAARAAVAAGYMKQCTGLWICAPINRAVDDKAAKSLLGESFKRQLKYDGQFSRITFICTKTDDISVHEASDSLGLEQDMAEDYAKIDEIEKKMRVLREKTSELRESKAVYGEMLDDADDAIDVWDDLRSAVEDGKTVFAPKDKQTSPKRKRSSTPKKSRKKQKKDRTDDDGDDDESRTGSDSESGGDSGDEDSDRGEPLTIEIVEAKLAELKDTKKKARKEKAAFDVKIKEIREELRKLEKDSDEIDTRMRAVCIKGRNKYSKGAIQQDFAAGIKELDQENAEEEDAENFNPEEDARDYDAVAKSLPVFCVSSRAYQQMNGRLKHDATIPGFRDIEQTEIPQLQAHCKKLTEAGRNANCRRYLNSSLQLILSLSLWASNDGTGLNLTDTQKAAEARWLEKKLSELEHNLDKSVADSIAEIKDVLEDNIFERFGEVIQLAVDQAPVTVGKWGAPVNRDNRAEGGLYWSTYKAVCRRDGVYGNGHSSYDFNSDLTEPIMKHLANNWEKAFARRVPSVLQSFTKKAKAVITNFHRDVEDRSRKNGAGAAGLSMLSQQLRTYEATFSIVTSEMAEAINNLQRDANREFVPVVAARLASAYRFCVEEHGSGSYMRMKRHMHEHVNQERHSMFKDSCDEVKKRLTQMCRHVEENMNNRTDEVFLLMRRDYLTVINGAQVKGDVMPKWERQMRAHIAHALEEHEKDEAQALEDADAAVEDRDAKNEAAAKEEEGDATMEEMAKEEDGTKEDTTENSSKGNDADDTTMEVDKPDVPIKESVENTKTNESPDANSANTSTNPTISIEAEDSEPGRTSSSHNSNDESTEEPTPTPSRTESSTPTPSGTSSPEN